VIGLDTSVLIRYLAQDDPAQSRLATRLIERELSAQRPGFVALPVLLETCWVMRRLYRASDAEARDIVADFAATDVLMLERREAVLGALARSRSHEHPFPDALIVELAARAGCAEVVTFDRQAERVGMRRLG